MFRKNSHYSGSKVGKLDGLLSWTRRKIEVRKPKDCWLIVQKIPIEEIAHRYEE